MRGTWCRAERKTRGERVEEAREGARTRTAMSRRMNRRVDGLAGRRLVSDRRGLHMPGMPSHGCNVWGRLYGVE